MDFKRILRTPLFWVIVVVATTLMVFSFSDSGGYVRIDTSAAEKLIAEDKVEKVKLTNNEVIDIVNSTFEETQDDDAHAVSVIANAGAVQVHSVTVTATGNSLR